MRMIVIGTDTHKRTHTCGAVDAFTAAARGELTAPAHRELRHAAALGASARRRAGVGDRGLPARVGRVRAVFDRARRADRARRPQAHGGRASLIARARQVGLDRRVQRRQGRAEGRDREPSRRAPGRRGARHSPARRPSRGSDRGTHRRPAAAALASARPLARARDPGRALDTSKWLGKISRRLARAQQTTRVRVARELVRQIAARTTRIRELESELAALVESYAPQLLAERGCGPLTAAKLIGEIAGADRFATDAKLARAGGAAPIPASSGNTSRHRLDRGGNRQLNCALHRLAVNKGKWDPDTTAYLARKQTEGKSRKEALRCLKRHLARRVWKLLQTPAPAAAAASARPTTPPTIAASAPTPMPCLT